MHSSCSASSLINFFKDFSKIEPTYSDVQMSEIVFKIPDVPAKRKISCVPNDHNCENNKRRRSTRLFLKANAELTSETQLLIENTSSPVLDRRRSLRTSQRISMIPSISKEQNNKNCKKPQAHQ